MKNTILLQDILADSFNALELGLEPVDQDEYNGEEEVPYSVLPWFSPQPECAFTSGYCSGIYDTSQIHTALIVSPENDNFK